jgi:hypothetical protein
VAAAPRLSPATALLIVSASSSLPSSSWTTHILTYHFLLPGRAYLLEMAEIFGAVASGAGLVSLSMQLLESAQKLKGFYDSARDAPATLEYLYRDLETVSLALHQFERYRQSDIPGNELLQRCIVTCERSVRSITTAVDKVDRLMHRARFAGRIYMGFKEPEVKRLLQEMEHAKSSMSLTYMGYCQYAIVSLGQKLLSMLTRCEDLGTCDRPLPHLPCRVNTRNV